VSQTDDVAVISGRCKRKSFFEPPVVSVRPVPADLSFAAVQPGTGWTGGWGTQQPCSQQATKFRRSTSDPQESDDRARGTFDPTLTSSSTSGGPLDSSSGLGEFSLLYDVDPEIDLAQYCSRIGSEPFRGGIHGGNGAPPPPYPDAFQLDHSDAWRSVSGSNLLAQLEEIGPPIGNWSADPNPEIASQHCNGYDSFSAPTVTGIDIGGCHAAPTPLAEMIQGSAAAINPPGHRLPEVAVPRRSGLPSPGSAESVLSPSTDSGFVDAAGGGKSPRSSTNDLPPPQPRHHDLPSDVIFQYVEDKLRELVRHATFSSFYS